MRAQPGATIGQAFSRAAFTLVELAETRSEYLDLDHQMMRLLGLYDDFVHAETELRAILSAAEQQHRQVSRITTEPYIRRMIPFNHALRELIDTNRGFNPNHLAQFLYIARRQLAGKSAADALGQGPLKLVHAMGNEVAAEDGLYQIDGIIDVIQASMADELRGIDLTAVGKNGVQAFDVKSSQRNAEISERRKPKSSSSKPVWTGLTPKDFADNFHLDDDAYRRIVAAFMPHLEEVLG